MKVNKGNIIIPGVYRNLIQGCSGWFFYILSLERKIVIMMADIYFHSNITLDVSGLFGFMAKGFLRVVYIRPAAWPPCLGKAILIL